MLVNLGMTADAAAAHEKELSGQTKRKAPALLPSPFSLPFKLMATGAREQPLSLSAPHVDDVRSASNPSETAPSPIYSSQGSIAAERSQEDLTAVENGTYPMTARPSRSRTSYRFAHPPPSARPKRLRIRARLILQLQQISPTARPIPTLDVIPFARFGSLAVGRRRFSNTIRPGAMDLAIVPSDSYEPATAEDDRSISSDEEQSDQRRVATLSHNRKDDGLPKGAVTIHQANEIRWTATSLPQGGYEFTSSNEHGVRQCVRWVLRGKATRRFSGSGVSGAASAGNDDKRFIFSVIDPRTRRHPVIGWLSKNGIDILDQWPQSTATESSSSDNQDFQLGGRTPTPAVAKPVDEHLSTLILATGIWTAFREGWSENPLHTDGQNSPVALSQAEAPVQSICSTVSKGGDVKRTETGPNQGGLSLPRVGTRLLGRPNMLQRSASSTAESWRSATASSPSAGRAEAEETEPKGLASPHPSANRRSKRLSLPIRGHQKRPDHADGMPATNITSPLTLEQTNGRTSHLNQNGGGGHKAPSTKPKKKRRAWCNWLDLGRKKKPAG